MCLNQVLRYCIEDNLSIAWYDKRVGVIFSQKDWL